MIPPGSIHSSTRHCYKAFGLKISSCIKLPEFSYKNMMIEMLENEEPDVKIRWGDVPASLDCPIHEGVRFQVKPNEFILTVDDIARYYLANGDSIIISPFPGATQRDMRLFLLGSVFGALFHQKGLFPLHGSAIGVDHECVVFCGNSGLGKSTIAGAMIQRGYLLHADDVCTLASIDAETDNKPMVFPACPHIKLWEDALKNEGQDFSAYSRVKSNIKKYIVPVPDQFSPAPLPLKKIYILCEHEKNSIDIAPLTGMEKLQALQRHTYRFRYLKGMDSQTGHFRKAADLAARFKIMRVSGPRGKYTLKELADALEADFRS